MSLSIDNRELDPFAAPFYVLCEAMIVAGKELKFGEPVPDYCDLHHLHVHFYHGVIGTKAELDALIKPVDLYITDPLQPIAKFTVPNLVEDEEVQTPLEAEEERGVFAIENAKLLKTKDDLIGYAAQFDITLKKATNISIKKMLETLEAEAKEKGLID